MDWCFPLKLALCILASLVFTISYLLQDKVELNHSVAAPGVNSDPDDMDGREVIAVRCIAVGKAGGGEGSTKRVGGVGA